jgi:tetratricopeptide (TPR) repeat protein
MKRTTWTLVIIGLLASGWLAAQDEASEAYIKAMTAQNQSQKAQLLKDFVSKYGGKGNQYENFAYANLCLLAYPSKTPKETIDTGEKALALGGLDDLTNYQVLVTVAGIYIQSGQNLDRAKSQALQAVELAKQNRNRDDGETSTSKWSQMIGAAYYVHAQACEKTRDFKSAVDSYIQSYNILKNKQILADLNKMGKALMDSKNYAEAEKLYRTLYTSAKDEATGTLLARSLYHSGRKEEAMAVFKEIYSRKKSGHVAYNIGIILAQDASHNPAQANEAIRYLLEAAFLSEANSKQAMALAENLFFTTNKDIKWNDIVNQITAINKKIEDLTKAYNTKFGDKEEDSLTPADKKEMKSMLDQIAAEKKKLEPLKASQEQVIDMFNKLIAETKTRLGIR